MFGANPATAEQFATSSNISNSVRTLVSISVYLCALLSAQGIMVDRGEMWRKTMKGRNTVSFSILIKDITPRFRPYNEGDLLPGFLGCKWPDTCQYVNIYMICVLYIYIYIYQWNWRSLKGSLFAPCQPSRSSSFFDPSSALKSNPTNSVISSMNSPSQSTAPEQKFTESTY